MMKKLYFLLMGLVLIFSVNISSINVNAKVNRTEKGQVVKTINPIKIYNGKVFKHAKVINSVKVGEELFIKKLVSTGGMTRFELNDGHYITANKRYVKLLNK